MTQVELAKILNVSARAVSTWETGERKPSLERVEWLADYFGASVDYILGRTEIPNLYAHNILLDDGRTAVYWAGEKDPTRQQLDRAVEIAQEAANDESPAPAPSVDLSGVLESLSALVRQIVDQALEERESGGGPEEQ